MLWGEVRLEELPPDRPGLGARFREPVADHVNWCPLPPAGRRWDARDVVQATGESSKYERRTSESEDRGIAIAIGCSWRYDGASRD